MDYFYESDKNQEPQWQEYDSINTEAFRENFNFGPELA